MTDFDFLGIADEVAVDDFENCLIDYMEYNFNLLIEDNSAKEVNLYTNYYYRLDKH